MEGASMSLPAASHPQVKPTVLGAAGRLKAHATIGHRRGRRGLPRLNQDMTRSGLARALETVSFNGGALAIDMPVRDYLLRQLRGR